MARLHVEDNVDFPREEVFETYRDHVAKLLDYLPTIEDIEVRSREQVDESTVELVNVWTADQADIPTMARKFINPEMLQWTDYATWHQDEWLCEWRMEVGFLNDAIDCSGETRYYEADEGRTRVVINGQLEVDATEIPGVPRLVAGKVGETVENFVVKLIEPNLTDVNRGIEAYLRDEI